MHWGIKLKNVNAYFIGHINKHIIICLLYEQIKITLSPRTNILTKIKQRTVHTCLRLVYAACVFISVLLGMINRTIVPAVDNAVDKIAGP